MAHIYMYILQAIQIEAIEDKIQYNVGTTAY